jgi:hypothetical protein
MCTSRENKRGDATSALHNAQRATFSIVEHRGILVKTFGIILR